MAIRINNNPTNEKCFKTLLSQHLSDKVKDIKFANALYGSLCNTIWYNKTTEDIYSCSWRYAGGLVADLRNVGENYLDFYCNGEEEIYHSEVYTEIEKLGYESLQYKNISYLQKFSFTGVL